MHRSVETKKIAKIIEQFGFRNYKIVKNDEHLFDWLKESRKPLVITGSLYFIGSIYKRLLIALR